MDQHKTFLNSMIDIKKTFVPYKTNLNKIRIGGDEDGGYVISEIPDVKYDALYSYGSDDNIKWQVDEEKLILVPPKNKPCEHVFVFKITLK